MKVRLEFEVCNEDASVSGSDAAVDKDGTLLGGAKVHGLNKQILHVPGVIIIILSSDTEIPFEHFVQMGYLSNKFTIFAQSDRPTRYVSVYHS